jgi:hypothetical protein
VITRDFGLLAGPTRVTSGDRSLEAAL